MSRKIIWEGKYEQTLLATIDPEAGMVEVFVYDGIDAASQAVSFEEFQRWASTTLAEIALIERYQKEDAQ